jgi:restriction endonuclease S subunit
LTKFVSFPIKEVCEIVGGNQPPKTDFIYEDKPGYIRLIQIRDYKSDKQKTYIPKAKATRFCNKEDIMIGRYGPPIFQILRGLEGAYNVALMKASPKNENFLDREYLYYFFQNKSLLNYIISNSERTAGQDGVRKELLDEYPIPLPPLAEQRRIAAIAQKADRLRRTRRYALQLSDTYLRSVFLEMFGNPATNPKSWEAGTLDDVIISAKDGPHVSPNYSDSGIPFLSTRNVKKGELIWEDLKFISYEDAKQHWKKCKPERGDVLYTKGGTTGLAKAIDFDREIAVWVHIAVLKLRRERVIPSWLESMLNTDFCYKQSQELTFGIVNRDLGLQRMPKIKI